MWRGVVLGMHRQGGRAICVAVVGMVMAHRASAMTPEVGLFLPDTGTGPDLEALWLPLVGLVGLFALATVVRRWLRPARPGSRSRLRRRSVALAPASPGGRGLRPGRGSMAVAARTPVPSDGPAARTPVRKRHRPQPAPRRPRG